MTPPINLRPPRRTTPLGERNEGCLMQAISHGTNFVRFTSCICTTNPLCTPAKTLAVEEWGGIYIHERRNFKFPLGFVVLSLTTETEPCYNQEKCSRIAQDIQAKDMDEFGLLNMRYNFLLGGDGQIYEGRGWKAKPAITGTFALLHGKYLHIACIGDYRGSNRPEAMYKAQWDLLQEGVDNMYLKRDFIFL